MYSKEEKKNYLMYLESFFHRIDRFYGEGEEVALIAPEGFPRCFVTVGAGLQDGKGTRFELVLSASPRSAGGSGEEAEMAAELVRIAKSCWEGCRFVPGRLVELSKEIRERYGFSSALLWILDAPQIIGEKAVQLLMLVPVYREEVKLMESCSVFDFVSLYHRSVAEEAMFHLDCLRKPLQACQLLSGEGDFFPEQNCDSF